MYEDDLEDEELPSGANIALSRILLHKVFAKLGREFTTDEFVSAFRRVFTRDADYGAAVDALAAAIDLDFVSMTESEKFEFNGIFWYTEDLN